MQLETLCITYLENPSHWLRVFEELPNLALLDSCNFAGESGRYHIITGAPQQWLTLEDGVLSYQNASQQSKTKANTAEQCWEAIRKLQNNLDVTSNLPFCGGLLGFVGYEFGVWSELGIEPCSEINVPDIAVGDYRWALVQDNHQRTSQLVFLPDCHADLRQKIIHLAQSSASIETVKSIQNNKLKPEVNLNSYKESLQRIQDYIQAGDCYQVNYTQRFANLQVQLAPLDTYQALRIRQPGPMAAFLDLGPNKALISLSPERLVKNDHGRVLAQPIKGTIARSQDKREDAALAQQLLDSEKDKAENLMIVDLLRNDLGRVCLPGSIHVPKLFELESFENVHHLISSIEGLLAPNLTNIDLLRACFPGGSITGAPKRRAMEIIEETELFGRNAYCGSVFYSSVNGQFDASITIRSLVACGTELYCWGGGGITSDSNTDDEYQESITKVVKLIGYED